MRMYRPAVVLGVVCLLTVWLLCLYTHCAIWPKLNSIVCMIQWNDIIFILWWRPHSWSGWSMGISHGLQSCLKSLFNIFGVGTGVVWVCHNYIHSHVIAVFIAWCQKECEEKESSFILYRVGRFTGSRGIIICCKCWIFKFQCIVQIV